MGRGHHPKVGKAGLNASIAARDYLLHSPNKPPNCSCSCPFGSPSKEPERGTNLAMGLSCWHRSFICQHASNQTNDPNQLLWVCGFWGTPTWVLFFWMFLENQLKRGTLKTGSSWCSGLQISRETHSFAHSLTPSLPHSLTPSLPPSRTRSLSDSFTPSAAQSLFRLFSLFRFTQIKLHCPPSLRQENIWSSKPSQPRHLRRRGGASMQAINLLGTPL